MDHMEYSIALPPRVELTNAGAEWTAMKQRHYNHVNPNATPFHQPSPANLFTSFLISISFDQVQDVFNILGLSVEEALRFNKILKNFEDLCLPRFLIIYNRYRFFMCKQNGPEFNGFLQQLLAWSDLCEFGELKDILLKDSIIRGISEESVRQHLLRTEQLDFNKTVEICKAGLVKQYATDNAKPVENEFADAWTDTCNDILENDNLVLKPQTIDKGIGNTVVAVEKETQTDSILNNEVFLVSCEEKELALDSGSNQKEKTDDVQTSNIVKTSLCSNDLLYDGLSCKLDQIPTNCDTVKVQTSNDLSPKDVGQNIEEGGSKKDTSLTNTVEKVNINCEFRNLRRSQRKRKKVVKDLNVAVIDNNLKIISGEETLNAKQLSSDCKDTSTKDGCQPEQLTQTLNDTDQSKKSETRRNDDLSTNATPVPSNGHPSDCHTSEQNKSPGTEDVFKCKSTEDVFKCKICSSGFQKETHLKAHSQVHSEDHQFICNICGYRYANVSRLKTHMRNHTNEHPYKCQDCKKSFKWSASLYRHRRTHTGERPYKCGQENCDSTFPDLTSLQRHAHTHTKIRPFKCVCGSTFADSFALRNHKRVHTGERPFHCNVCDAAFARAQHLKDHQKLHTGEKPFECEICHAKFIEASKLKSHRRKHTGERPYSCETCEKSFTWLAAYKRHLKTHTLEKPYKCETCGVAFADTTTLVRHKRIHTGEKPYRCDECFTSFADSSSLSRHRKTHSTAKDYACSVCNAKFAVRAYLVKHLRTHSGQKSYQCNICSAKFGDSSKLNRHKKIHTKSKNQDFQVHKQRETLHQEQQQQQNQQDLQQRKDNDNPQQKQQLELEEQYQHDQLDQQQQQQYQELNQHHQQQYLLVENQQELNLHQTALLEHYQYDQQEQQPLQQQQNHHHDHHHQQLQPDHYDHYHQQHHQDHDHHHQQGSQHQQQHQHQQLEAVESTTTNSDSSSFLLWHENPQAGDPSSVLGVNVAETLHPLLLANTSSDDLTSTSHHQHIHDDHDMSQYLSSQLLEFDDDGHHPHHNHHLQHHHQQHSSEDGSLHRLNDQGFIDDIHIPVMTTSVLDDILNIKS